MTSTRQDPGAAEADKTPSCAPRNPRTTDLSDRPLPTNCQSAVSDARGRIAARSAPRSRAIMPMLSRRRRMFCTEIDPDLRKEK
jgi:hypothetical protein